MFNLQKDFSLISAPKLPSEKQKLAIKQSKLFSKEQERQRNAIGRIEKIEVQYKGAPEDVTLLMNKHLSTPFECAQRQSLNFCNVCFYLI